MGLRKLESIDHVLQSGSELNETQQKAELNDLVRALGLTKAKAEQRQDGHETVLRRARFFSLIKILIS